MNSTAIFDGLKPSALDTPQSMHNLSTPQCTNYNGDMRIKWYDIPNEN